MKLSVEQASFAYKNGPEILQEISLEAAEGELVAILGPNGVGKTTLLKCMLGLIPWKSGRTCINEVNIREMNPRRLWQQVAYVPQAKSGIASYTVEEMLLLGRASHIDPFSAPEEEDLAIAQSVMKRLSIEHLRNKRCTEISGGELQMALIGRALVSGSGILVLDEPESNLDFKNQLVVLDTLKNLTKEGKICIFNTHYPAHALQRADKALLLAQDGTSRFGATEEIITEENIEKAFGIQSVIRDIETEYGTVRDVIPVQISGQTGGQHD